MASTHPSKRHNDPMKYQSGKPRLRPLNVTQLAELLTKTQSTKEKAKISRELFRKEARQAV